MTCRYHRPSFPSCQQQRQRTTPNALPCRQSKYLGAMRLRRADDKCGLRGGRENEARPATSRHSTVPDQLRATNRTTARPASQWTCRPPLAGSAIGGPAYAITVKSPALMLALFVIVQISTCACEPVPSSS